MDVTNSAQQGQTTQKNILLGLWAVFTTYFISNFFISAINIAQPKMVAELNGMAMFSWLIAIPALFSAVSALLFGKLSDIHGRRSILLVSIALFVVGLALSALSQTMVVMIGARAMISFGLGGIAPLCLSVIGDFFPPEQRSRWTGMLSLPGGIAAMIALVLGGIITESVLGWRGFFWITIPFVLLSGGLIALGIPKPQHTMQQRIDIWGIAVMVIACAAGIIGILWLGSPGKFGLGVGLVFISAIAWAAFIYIEKNGKEPILDPQVLFNRTFITAAGAGFFSIIGYLGVLVYTPIFAQNVMGVSPTVSGLMLTPFSVLTAFMGISAGFLLAKIKSYKWIYIVGYHVATIALLFVWRFTEETPIWLFVIVTSLAGLGLGIIPTINSLVVQFAVPRQLLGSAIGALFFFLMMGNAIAPAILGLVQNSATDLEGGLQQVFLVCAATMALALMMIITIPEVSMDGEVNLE